MTAQAAQPPTEPLRGLLPAQLGRRHCRQLAATMSPGSMVLSKHGHAGLVWADVELLHTTRSAGVCHMRMAACERQITTGWWCRGDDAAAARRILSCVGSFQLLV